LKKTTKKNKPRPAVPHIAGAGASRRRVRWIVAIVLTVCAALVLWLRPWNDRIDRASQSTGTVSVSDAEVFSAYAGSSSCRACHAQAYESWSASHHGLAERPTKPELDRPAFDPPRSFQHGSQSSEVRAAGDAFEIISADLTTQKNPHRAERVIGVDPLRQFLVAAAGGRLQAMEAAYDPRKNDWFNVYGNEDRQPGEWGHWTGRGMTWNAMCAACHNTRLRKNYDEPSDSYHTTMAEMSVSCEACHGPMKPHVQWEQQYAGTGKKDPGIRKLSRDQMLDTCGSCHARRGELTRDFAPGDSFFDHYMLNIVDGSDVFYANGLVRDEDYEFSAFLGSKMHAAGVRCVDCHDPHSGKTLATGNALCMRCHAGTFPKAPLIDPIAHSFHKADSAGSQCINCHMPQTTYMQRHGRHDHGFTVPDPLLTKTLAIPNACNLCHTDKDADWALSAATQWYGAKLARPARARAETIAAARRGDDATRTPLLSLLKDAVQPPYWKAVAAGLLERWAADPAVNESLRQQLSANEPLLRATAVRALSPLAQGSLTMQDSLRRMLIDPVREVRIAAAHATMSTLDPQSANGREFQQFLDLQADQPTGQLQQAQYLIGRNEGDRAIVHLRKAVEWDARSPAIRREVAIAYSTLGHPREAAAQFEEACRLDPNHADDHYLLGLAYSELDQPEKTLSALERAVQLDPRHARAWYNLGLVRRNLGQTNEALDALRRAESADPTDPDYPYARATLLAQLGKIDEARGAAERSLAIRADYAPAQQLIRSLAARTGS
jgi:predicted CXXCH cytochrome family protein